MITNIPIIFFYILYFILTLIYGSNSLKLLNSSHTNFEALINNETNTLGEFSTDELSESLDSISLLKNNSLHKDYSFYSDDKIMEYNDVTGFLGLIIVYVKKRQDCRILSGNFSRVNEGENSFYLFFDTVNKNYVAVSVSGILEFSLTGKLGKVTFIYKDETFLLNKFLLIKSDGDLIQTDSPWKLNIEINSDYNKIYSIPGLLKNKNLIKLPPDNWDANLDSVYPNNIKKIMYISTMNKRSKLPKKLAIPHIPVGSSPTALFLKLNTNEYMSIFLPNNTIFFVDIDDCSIHSHNGHYYNICDGYSVYNNRWYLTNKPWEGLRIIICNDLEKLYQIVKLKLEELQESIEKPRCNLTNALKTSKLRISSSPCIRRCRCHK